MTRLGYTPLWIPFHFKTLPFPGLVFIGLLSLVPRAVEQTCDDRDEGTGIDPEREQYEAWQQYKEDKPEQEDIA